MMAAGKKKPDEMNTDIKVGKRSLRNGAEEQLARVPKRSADLKGQTPEQLVHELQVHQIQLETQAEELRRAKIELEESRDKYLDLYEFAPLGYFTLTNKGLIAEVNLSGATLLGVERSSLLRAHFSKFMPEKDSDKWHRYFMNVLRQDEKQTCTITLTRGDGSEFLARLEGIHLQGSDRAITIRIAISDITDIWQIDALKKSEEKYRMLINNLNEGIWVIDKEAVTTFVNPKMANILGYTMGDMTGRSLFSFMDEKGRQLSEGYIERRQFGIREPCYFEFLKRDGTRIYASVAVTSIKGMHGEYQGAIAGVIDITDRIKAEEELRESRDRFKATIASLDDAILLVDPQTRLIIESNDATTRIFGYSHKELVGKTTNFLHVDQAHVEQFGREAMATYEKPGYYTREFKMRRKDGCVFPTEHFVRPIHGQDGRIRYVVSVVRDITERKKTEETIRHALAEKEVLLREVHHRVRNNLAGILSLIELQISSLSDPVQITQFMDLETRIRSMALVHESLSLAKDLTHINVASYTKNLTHHLFKVYGTGGDVQCKIEMEDIPLPIETAIPCGLVMSEIVTNSLKYAFPKTFSCEEIRGEPCTITLTLHRDGSDYILGISDNGIGIPEGIDVTISHSLGLFLIRFIVEHQLRGNLDITAAGGTAYTIRFPEPAVMERNPDEKM